MDAVKHYFNDLKGENFIHYTPNAGHELNGGQQAQRSVSAFFCNTFADIPYAECSWEVSESGTGVTLDVEGSANAIIAANLWSADSQDRDFRDEVWSSIDLDALVGEGLDDPLDNSSVNTTLDYPETGFRAFYIDLNYRDLYGREYTLSTQMFVVDNDELL